MKRARARRRTSRRRVRAEALDGGRGPGCGMLLRVSDPPRIKAPRPCGKAAGSGRWRNMPAAWNFGGGSNYLRRCNLTGEGSRWETGRCAGRGCGWNLRGGSWHRGGIAAGARADGGSTEQRRRGGAGSSAPAERGEAAARVCGAARGWMGCRGAVGSQLKAGGDPGEACPGDGRVRDQRWSLRERVAGKAGGEG